MDLTLPTPTVTEYRVPSILWCKSIAIDRQENYVAVGFENCLVRFFKTATSEQPREDNLHFALHSVCRGCPSVDTLAFSEDGLCLLAGTRSAKGVVQIYLWRFPFENFEELISCRYAVPMHESEDNGISAVIMRSQQGAEDSLLCVTTWTQSGTPVLIQPQDGYRTEIKPAPSSIHGKLGNRIKCAAFSASGRQLAMVNDKGHFYLISNLNSKPMDIRRRATTRELTSKSCALAMSFMTLASEETAVMVWVDPSRGKAFMRKTSVGMRVSTLYSHLFLSRCANTAINRRVTAFLKRMGPCMLRHRRHPEALIWGISTPCRSCPVIQARLNWTRVLRGKSQKTFLENI